MSSLAFKTRTELLHRENPSKDNVWVIAEDIGYSSVKLMCPNKVGVFPSYARKITENKMSLKEESPTDIRYRDSEGMWVIGNLAYEDVNSSEVIESESELFGRNRYNSPMFKVLARTGLAIGLIANSYGNPEGKAIKVQTGLPPKYLKADKEHLTNALSGHHQFDIRIGKAPWQHFDFTLNKEDIFVMPQPLGALVSTTIGKNGKQVSDAKRFFNSNVVIIDPGCGTCDEYVVKNGKVVDHDTHPELSMHEVFSRTCKNIFDVYGLDIQVPELQNYLESGTVRVLDTSGPRPKRKTCSFENILKENCKKVCNEAIEKLNNRYNYFLDTDLIIATGGTYDAWGNTFSDAFMDMDDLRIIPGNINEPELSNIYSNVRGYYYYLLNSLK